MTQEESPIFLGQVTPVGEVFIANGVACIMTVKANSKSPMEPSVGSEQDDTIEA